MEPQHFERRLMKWKDICVGSFAWLVQQKIAVKKTHRISGVSINYPASQLDAGYALTIGPDVEIERIENGKK